MKVPLSWLKEYVDVKVPVAELAQRMTMAGVEVGEVIQIGGWQDCFVGQVLAVRPHPNADRLRLCRVTTGTEETEVVCGAPNVAESQKICFARAGAIVFNTHTGKRERLKPSKIRGVVSEGMICSEVELGLGEDHEGILVLPDTAPVGVPLDRYLGDTILDLEVTANRLDCLSILGVAHEVATLTDEQVREPEAIYPEDGPAIASQVSVSIADPDLCHRYTASLICGVKIATSPAWLQERLTKGGLRPINNVVDATNYVMLEYNQPLHAFDFDKVRGHAVIVRRAEPGEVLVTLDGLERKLQPDSLVIADAQGPMGIGGIIGGADSEIGDGTDSVLLESATFDSFNNRRTAEVFKLRTDATLRFEKGLRIELAPIALRRATQLIQQIAGGAVAQGIIDVYPQPQRPPTIVLTQSRMKKVLGMVVDPGAVEKVLDSLAFPYCRKGKEAWEVTVPYWRNDVNIEDDLVEEVVRITGYDSVPTTMLSTPIPYFQPDAAAVLRDRVKDALVAAGMQEIITYPTASLEDLNKVHQSDSAVRLANPLNANQQYLRNTLRASLLATLAANQMHQAGPFRLFEASRVFLPRPGQLPHEVQVVAGVLAGRRWEPSWLVDDSYLDFFDAKGVVENVLARLGVPVVYRPADEPLFQPGKGARIVVDNVQIGFVGELHPTVREQFDFQLRKVSIFELDLDKLTQPMASGSGRFKSLSRFPAATRDMALVVASDIPTGRVQEILLRNRLVERAELFDVYTGDKVPLGARSLAFHLYFQSQDRTLTTEEIDRALDGLLRAVQREVGATLRS